MGLFQLHTEFPAAGDQPAAITALADGLRRGHARQTLRGVTGSGKTFTLAGVIAQQDQPVLVLSHNKTLAAQLYSEFKSFFPQNAVEYFISYYDYYLPESYIPATDTYIAKDASINDNLERLRLSTTASLIERRDVIVVASVSCLYGLGSPEDYAELCLTARPGMAMDRDALLHRLVEIQYERNDLAPEAGQFRVRGDSVDIFEPQRDDFIRIGFWGSEIESISRHHAVSGQLKSRAREVMLFPCKHFVMPKSRIENAAPLIMAELRDRVAWFEKQGRLVEAQRLYQRVTYDLEMMRELGYCSGIENYSFYLSSREPGSRPFCLLDYFPGDFLTVIDESHVTLPQVQGMFKADRSRKETLAEHGFRLLSALENRPLQYAEFDRMVHSAIYVSATPGPLELELCAGRVVEQVIRPTGLLDPEIELRPLEGQVDDVLAEIRLCVARGERVLVTTLTKKSSERLAEYLSELGVRASYLHSELDALERVRVLAKLRNGDFDCLIGINLLREGIDLPEVALVAILDADKEGFLRSDRSLIQVAGRAARNERGRVLLYGDTVTPSMRRLMEVTRAHRQRQMAYNEAHGIVPKTIVKSQRLTIGDAVAQVSGGKKKVKSAEDAAERVFGDGTVDSGMVMVKNLSEEEFEMLVTELEREMLEAADALEFERAADLRDRVRSLKREKETAEE